MNEHSLRSRGTLCNTVVANEGLLFTLLIALRTQVVNVANINLRGADTAERALMNLVKNGFYPSLIVGNDLGGTRTNVVPLGEQRVDTSRSSTAGIRSKAANRLQRIMLKIILFLEEMHRLFQLTILLGIGNNSQLVGVAKNRAILHIIVKHVMLHIGISFIIVIVGAALSIFKSLTDHKINNFLLLFSEFIKHVFYSLFIVSHFSFLLIIVVILYIRMTHLGVVPVHIIVRVFIFILFAIVINVFFRIFRVFVYVLFIYIIVYVVINRIVFRMIHFDRFTSVDLGFVENILVGLFASSFTVNQNRIVNVSAGICTSKHNAYLTD